MTGKNKKTITLVLVNIFFVVICFATLVPILYAVSVSFNADNSLLSSDFSFIPRNFTLKNLTKLWLMLISKYHNCKNSRGKKL